MLKNPLHKTIEYIKKKRFPYEPLIKIEISAQNILHNYNQFRKLNNRMAISPVLKSNAYGHGIDLIASILDKENPPFFSLDAYFEAIALRNAGVKSPILVIGYTFVDTIINCHLKDVAFTITSLEMLKELDSKIKKVVKIHLKIDTGMARQGISYLDKDKIKEAIDILEKNKNIVLEGIMSHLSDADNDLDNQNTLKQIEYWNDCILNFKNRFPNIKFIHLSATSGHLYIDKISPLNNVSRLGLGLYGIPTSKNLSQKVSLRPALKVKTVISGIKKIQKGNLVGYNGTFLAKEDMTIATIPMGYNEGIDRRLSNKGFVRIGDVFCPIIGRVSMNITTIDISGLVGKKLNDEVIVISNDASHKNSIENIAKDCQTIPYEILVHLSPLIKRVS